MLRYTVYYIWKLLYIFRVVSPFIIRSACKCIYSIWYLSHRYCYLPLSWKSWQVAVTVWHTGCCRYSCMRSWWWVEVPPETCRAVSRYNTLCNVASCWIYIGISLQILHNFNKCSHRSIWKLRTGNCRNCGNVASYSEAGYSLPTACLKLGSLIDKPQPRRLSDGFS